MGIPDPARPIILIADQPWDSPGGGAVILRSLIEKELGHGLIWVTPTRKEQDLKLGRVGLRSGSLGRHGKFSLFYDSFRYPGSLANEVAHLARQTNAIGLWVVLHGATIAIAAHLLRTRDLPMHATVHDDPVHATALRSRRLALLTPIIARQFRQVMRGAHSVDVVCQPMAERYHRKFGVNPGILHRGLSDAPSPAPGYDIKRDGLTVGVLGNTYSYRQLPLLGQSVAIAAARLGVRGRIVVCGGGWGDRLREDMKDTIDVEVTGHIPEQAGILRLQRCGFLYLNYPFGRMNRVLGETSFPTKLSTYIYASRPLFLHAPEGTSLKDLPKLDGFIASWTNLNPADGAAALISMIESPGFGQSHHVAAESLRARYYDLAVHHATLSTILDKLAGAGSSQQPEDRQG